MDDVADGWQVALENVQVHLGFGAHARGRLVVGGGLHGGDVGFVVGRRDAVGGVALVAALLALVLLWFAHGEDVTMVWVKSV